MGVVRDPRIAQRTQQDGVVVLGQGTELLVRNGDPVPQVALGSEVELVDRDLTGRSLADALQHPRRLARHLAADPVSGDDGDSGHTLPVDRVSPDRDAPVDRLSVTPTRKHIPPWRGLTEVDEKAVPPLE